CSTRSEESSTPVAVCWTSTPWSRTPASAMATTVRSATPLRERGMVQAQVARAEALVGSARAFAWEAVGEVWRRVRAGEEPRPRQRARFRLAITNAVSSAVQAVDLVYAAGPLDRRFRDIHTLAQHAALAPITLEPAGRMLLGLDPGAPFF